MADGLLTLILSDCLEAMAAMPPDSIDAIVTDPPYGLGFMGKAWDGLPPGPETAAAMLRVLRPSSYLLAFGGTRTWHRLACALEDAGFEIRDTLMWLYGSGFPKGKSCLKPAYEPVILARKPGRMRELGIEECRIACDWLAERGETWLRSGNQATATDWQGPKMARGTCADRVSPSGRWPANVLLDECAAELLDQQTGVSAAKPQRTGPRGGNGFGGFDDEKSAACIGTWPADQGGGASRFFYCAKASRRERNEGCEGMEAQERGWKGRDVCTWIDRKDGKGRVPVNAKLQPAANHHPTVKPVAVMRWLVRLVARPGDTVLDPFMGSGTTGVACAKEGREFIGIEREDAYMEIARRRIEHAEGQLQMAAV